MKILKGPRLDVRSVAKKKLNHLPLTKEGSLVKRSVASRVVAVHYSDRRTLMREGERGDRKSERERKEEGREPTKRSFLKIFISSPCSLEIYPSFN